MGGGVDVSAHHGPWAIAARLPCRSWRLQGLLALLLLGTCLTSWPLTATSGATLLQGAPLMLRFGPEALEALPNIFAIAGDEDGWIYAANLEGVLRFDGERWQLTPMPGNALARALAIDAGGRVFVGGEDNFGEIETTATGMLRYRDLREAFELDGGGSEVGTVWQALALPEGVYFHSDGGLFLYANDGAHRRWPLPEGVRSFYSDGVRLYARIAGRGLVEIRDGAPVEVAGGEVFAEQTLAGMVVSRSRVIAVGGRALYVLGEEGLRPLARAPWDESVVHGAYEVVALADGSLLAGTLGGEAYRLDPNGALLSRFDLGAGAVRTLFRDREGAVWVGADRGVLRLPVQLGWSFLGESHGIQGWLHDIEWRRDTLWLAGSRGLGRVRAEGNGTPTTQWLELFDFEAFDLLGFEEGLLVAHRNGVLWWRDEDHWRELLPEAEPVVELMPVGDRPGAGVFAIGQRSLIALGADGRDWRVLAVHPLEGLSVWGVEMEQPGVLWLGDARGPPQRWRLDPDTGTLVARDVLGEAAGLRLEAGYGSAINRLDGDLVAVSGRQTYRWDGQAWRHEQIEPFARFERPMDVRLEHAADGLYAYDTETILRRAEGTAEWRTLGFDTVQARGVTVMRNGRDGILRIGTWLGLLQRDDLAEPPPPPPLQVRLFAATVLQRHSNEAETPLPLHSSETAPIAVGFDRSLRLRFGLLAAEPEQEFRYRINGDSPEEGWSVWSKDRQLLMRTGIPGRFRVDVEGRVRNGRTVEPLTVFFETPAPWYRTLWGLALVLLLGAAVIAAAVRVLTAVRTHRLAERNKILEARIAERTRELEDANRRLAELATEDPVTGVLNRRALDHGLQREWVRSLDQHQPLALIMIDVDHFKRYNDEHGHLEGDRMLRRIAGLLRERHDPKRELLARFGGEEFALVVPGARLDEAERRAEALRVELGAACRPITISAGVAMAVPDLTQTPTDLLRKADNALYQAKRQGRNRVVAAED